MCDCWQNSTKSEECENINTITCSASKVLLQRLNEQQKRFCSSGAGVLTEITTLRSTRFSECSHTSPRMDKDEKRAIHRHNE